MSKFLDRMTGRYFLCFLLITLVCYIKNWDKCFEIAIATFFVGGICKVVWGKEDAKPN